MSLIKQRQEMIEKRCEDAKKQQLDHNNNQAKDNMKVMAKIAYKEWKEKKNEETRHKRKFDAMEKRRQQMEEEQIRAERRQLVREMQKRKGNSG